MGAIWYSLLALAGFGIGYVAQWLLWGRRGLPRLAPDEIMRQALSSDNPAVADAARQYQDVLSSMSAADRDAHGRQMQMMRELYANPDKFDEVWERWAWQIPSLRDMTDEKKAALRQRTSSRRRRNLLPWHSQIGLALPDIPLVLLLWPRFIDGTQAACLAVGMLAGGLFWIHRGLKAVRGSQ